MRRVMIWTVVTAATLLLASRLAARIAPAARTKCAEACENMLAKMPESFPPNRMMSDLETIKEQTAGILDQMERRSGRAGDPVGMSINA
jgi:hypothetical protein